MKNQERKIKPNLLLNYLFRLFFLLLCSCGAFAQNPITRVQSKTGNSGSSAATSFVVTLSSTPIDGNTLVAIIATKGASANRVSSISQTGATWVRASQATNINGSTTEIWYASNVSSASKTITINQASLRSAAVVVEYDDILTVSPVDKISSGTGNSTSALTGTTTTTTQANELMIGGIGLVNSGYTLGTPSNSFNTVAISASTSGTANNNARVYAFDKMATATETANTSATVSTSSQWSGAIATFKALNTVSSASSTPTLCINTALTSITHTTTGATGIGTATGLPTGVTASWASNTITISGTPAASGTFNYTILLTGGSGSINATGTITVTAANTVGVASSSPNLCINNALTSITHTTTAATGIGTATGLPTGVSASWASNTITISGTPTVSGTFNYNIPLTGGCATVNATGTIVVNQNAPVTQIGSAYTFCVDNGSTYTSATVSSSQYILVNVIKGFTYTFTVGNVFTDTENLTILDAATDGNVSPASYASGASGASISNWVASLSGQIKVLLSNGTCSTSNGSGGAITLTLNAVGNTQDSQTAYGTDQWVAHVYNWTGTPAPGGASPTTPSTTTSPFTSANYVGYYNVATESISDTFGGDNNCFPVYSNGVIRTNMYTEQFAVRYRMRSTKTGCYSLSTSGDDGVRVYVDGVKVYDEWKEQSPTSYSNILLYLNGNSDIIFDYYENGGQNVNSFSLTPFDASSNSIAQSSITVCSGVSAGLLNATAYTYNGSVTNPTISFQWQTSTDNVTFTNISGATSEDYTPPTQTTTTTNVVRYYRRIVTASAATASGCSYTSNVVTVTTSPGVPTTPGTVSGTAYQCQSLTNQVYSISSVSNATSYNWTVPTGWTITAGAGTNSIIVTTGTTGQNGTISVVAVNGCGTSSAKNLAVTVNSSSFAGLPSSSPTLCVNTVLTSITHSTSGATGIGTATGLPSGVTAAWASNTITISGTPTVTGVFNYSIPLTGGCGLVNATGTITVNSNLPVSVSIGASATTICSGSSVTFTATPTNGGTTPSYQWKLNGNNVGTNSATYTTTTLANGNTVTVVMTSNASSCLTSSTATSNAITMTVSSPSVGGAISGGTAICSAINSTTLTLTGNTGSVTKWQSSTVSNFASSITDIANTSTTLIVTNLSATLYYRAVISNGSCSSANSSVATIQYDVPVGMSALTPLVSELSGNATTTITASGVVGVNPVVKWYSGSGQVGLLGTGLTSPSVGVGTYYAVVTGSCGSSVELSVTIRSLNNWTGAVNTFWNVPGNWSEQSVPDATTSVTIGTGKVAEIVANDAEAYNITISGTGTLTVKSGKNLTLTNGFTTAAASSLVLENNANLIQLSATANTTPITVKRDTNALIRLDYTMWSSPVIGQKLFAFSPLTAISPTIRFYTYNTTTNSYNSVPAPSTTDFEAGKGYLIRLPYNHPTTPAVWSGTFSGIPNNGTKVVALSNIDETHQYNTVGNPYPSPISVAQFMIDNASKIEPTIYFWRKTNNAVKPSYCTWNSVSQTFSSNGEAFSANPNGVIQTGQGFIVEAKGSANSIEFNNGQRVLNNVSHFFKTTNASATSSTESHRIWLNLTGTNSEFSQTVLGYFTNATQGEDAYDSKLFNDGSVSLSMKIGTADYTIQGRPVPFDASEVVTLSYKVTTAGSYTISIDQVDGLFTGGAQAIFLRDNLLGTCNNLSTSAYTFTSNPGSFETRFELLYQNSLLSNNTTPTFNASEVVIYHQKSDLIINTGVATMSSIKIFNIKGALLFDKKEINASETKVDIGSTNEVLLVEIVTTEGVKVVKKVYSELVIGSDDDE